LSARPAVRRLAAAKKGESRRRLEDAS